MKSFSNLLIKSNLISNKIRKYQDGSTIDTKLTTKKFTANKNNFDNKNTNNKTSISINSDKGSYNSTREYIPLTGDMETPNNRYGKDTSFKTQENNRKRISDSYTKYKNEDLAQLKDQLIAQGLFTQEDYDNNNFISNEKFKKLLGKRTWKEYMDYEDHINAQRNQQETYYRRTDKGTKKQDLAYLAGRFENKENSTTIPEIPVETEYLPDIDIRTRNRMITKDKQGSYEIEGRRSGAGGHGDVDIYRNEGTAELKKLERVHLKDQDVQNTFHREIKEYVTKNPNDPKYRIKITPEQAKAMGINYKSYIKQDPSEALYQTKIDIINKMNEEGKNRIKNNKTN